MYSEPVSVNFSGVLRREIIKEWIKSGRIEM